MIRRIVHLTVFVLAVAACSKKDDKPVEQKAAPAAAAPAKASREECEKVVANQLALETDASIKNAMEQSKEAMTTSCLDTLTSPQAACAAKATSAMAFGDCIIQK